MSDEKKEVYNEFTLSQPNPPLGWHLIINELSKKK
jgi:hypothetical protein